MHTVAPARAVAFSVLRRVFEQGAYADRALLAEAGRAGLDVRDRALATRLAYGAVQHKATLDHVVQRLAARPAARLDPPVLAALRLGLEQVLFLDAVPDHAAVDESVELAKGPSPGGARLVNAVLRRATDEGAGILAGLDDATPQGAALRHSFPRWIAELWWGELGARDARALMAASNEPAEVALRVNALVSDPETLAGELRAAGVSAHRSRLPPDALVIDGPFDAHGSALHARGAFMPQSRAAAMVAHVVGPRPGERVLDLCAAPGGKTTHLAALMEGEGELIAVERHPGRARALQDTCRRMGAGNVHVRVADGRDPTPGGPFDRVLVDPPCTGLGTLRSRPDLRWRVSASDVGPLAETQAGLLAAGAASTAPGGTLVYSTCTISPEENERQIDGLVERDPGLAVDDLCSDVPLWHHPGVPFHLQTLPHRDGTDGFFFARLRRER